MKRINNVILIMMTTAFFTACMNHSDNHSAKDTVGNRYGADTAKIEKMNKDTSAITGKTGDASNLDNSASGGANITKDTAKKGASGKNKK